MSASPDAQALWQAMLHDVFLNYIYVSVIAFYAFDILLTVPSEVKLMWKRRPRITMLLYFTVRYFVVPRIILQYIGPTLNPKTYLFNVKHSISLRRLRLQQMQRSTVYSGWNEYMYASRYIRCTLSPWFLVLTGQVWAIYNRDRRVLVVLGILAVAICVSDALQASASTCTSTSADLSEWVTFSITLQAGFAACVMVLTLYQVRRMVDWRDGIRSLGTETQFKYTRLVIGESLRRITLFLTSQMFQENINLFSAPFIPPIETVLVSRLLLDLHEAMVKDMGPATSYLSYVEIGRDRQHGESVGVPMELLEIEATADETPVRQ
ncbi:hypothetical protein K439DRAFT_1615343 [Ramaria rubella]|nr:hypothetical protein K439DRAFT_1615343 [Ramaria rubella]